MALDTERHPSPSSSPCESRRAGVDSESSRAESRLRCEPPQSPSSSSSDSPPPQNHHHRCSPASRTLKFSIENILSPNFGKSAKDNKNKEPSPVSPPLNGSPAAAVGHADDTSSRDSTKSSCNGENTLPPLDGATPPPPLVWPAWVYCTRYSDRPSSDTCGRLPDRLSAAAMYRGTVSKPIRQGIQAQQQPAASTATSKGPRSRRIKKKDKKPDEKRPRTAFTAEQLARLKQEFQENRYLTEKRRQDLARDLKLNESQIKIWFQNKRAKIKKASGQRNPLALHLMAQGLYNHSTVPVREGEENGDNSSNS